MHEGWRDVLGAWEELGPRVDEYRELDHERVLVLFHYSGRGQTSGLELGQLRTHGANVFHVRAGKRPLSPASSSAPRWGHAACGPGGLYLE